MQAFENVIQQLRESDYEGAKRFMMDVLGYSPAQAEQVIYNAKRILGRLPEQQRKRNNQEAQDE